MADDVVIRAEGLGKKYVIGHAAERERYVALRDVLARSVRNFGRTTMDLLRGRPMVVGDELEEFWALRDVNFEIRRGDVVGVIGRNGAGKSTLLKILSRITEPTEGRVTIKGRVASLLEVGTGFHPELTGRENIYLNGAILGMTHAEIRRKFDEIVAFAEVERFLDTPVKRFSSGMYVRLAFAVAAHLEPEILVVDEVLAVGDAEFQKKCLGKIGEVAGHGRTVLFVSHNMSSVQGLCSRGLLLDRGALVFDGATNETVATYLEGLQSLARQQNAPVDNVLTLVGTSACASAIDRSARVTLHFRAADGGTVMRFQVILHDYRRIRVAVLDSFDMGAGAIPFRTGDFTVNVDIDHMPLLDGRYGLDIWMQTEHSETHLADIGELDLTGFSKSRAALIAPVWRGVVELQAKAGISAAGSAFGNTLAAAERAMRQQGR